MILEKVRISYPELFVAKAFEDQAPKFSVAGLIEPGSENDKLLEAEILRVAKAKWGAKAEAQLKAIRGNNMKFFYRPAGEKDKPGYDVNNFFSAKSTSRPTVFNRDKAPLAAEDGVIYSGCFCDLSIDVYAHAKGGITASLKGVRFNCDGDRFGGSAPAKAEDFPDLDFDPAYDFA